jgi:hypothetical protein
MARATTKDKAEALETIPVTNPEADNHHMVMTIAATNSPDQLPGGAMTADMADERLRTWQQQGYKVKTSQVIQAGDVNGIYTLQVFYLLIKE